MFGRCVDVVVDLGRFWAGFGKVLGSFWNVPVGGAREPIDALRSNSEIRNFMAETLDSQNFLMFE